MIYQNERGRFLRRFEKIDLKPGESKQVSFEIDARDLAFYNYKNQQLTEKGAFSLKIKDLEQIITVQEDIVYDEPSKVRL